MYSSLLFSRSCYAKLYANTCSSNLHRLKILPESFCYFVLNYAVHLYNICTKLCLRKKCHYTSCRYNFDIGLRERILTIFGKNVIQKVIIKRCFIFPLHYIVPLYYLWTQETPKLGLFT